MAALVLARPVFARRRSIVLSRPTPIIDSEVASDLMPQSISWQAGFATFGISGTSTTGTSMQHESKNRPVEDSTDQPNAEAGPSRLTRTKRNDRRRVEQGEALQESELEHTDSKEWEKKKKHVCQHDGCGKAFKKAAKLADHMLSHTDDRPHQCPHCPSRYKKPTHLSAHIRTHLSSESKTFVCCKMLNSDNHPEETFQAVLYDRADGLSSPAGENAGGSETSRMRAICGKKFWTSQHLKRHEETCGQEPLSLEIPQRSTSPAIASIPSANTLTGIAKGKGIASPIDYPCPNCPERFRKHRLLQSHFVETHAGARNAFEEVGIQAGGSKIAQQAGVNSKWLVPVAKRYRCDQEGCEWSFETMQKLKGHAKTHNASRYICGHADHSCESEKPKFRTWTDLQKHMRDEHPPCCPYPECNKRQFTRQSNLRDHLRIHAERGETIETSAIAELKASRVQPLGSAVDDEGDDEFEMEMTSRKRKRSESLGGQASPNRRLRRASSVGLVKDWVCQAEGCAKSFKTETALKKHNQTAHLGLRPFVCSESECDKSFGHRHLLQRHIAAKHKQCPTLEDTTQPTLISTQPPTTVAGLQSPPEKAMISTLDLLTGASRGIEAQSTGRLLHCPVAWTSTVSGCGHRSIKVYDLQRHIKKQHGLDLEEVEVRMLLLQAEGYVSRR